ncbi:GlcNAc-transferase family protein [Erwinia sp. MYb375]|uniref:GlcNAc-transferase family protein n=1 Tax=Erwinia sp. MYb375 TaxID=2745272 RepID=UPI0030A11CA0
MDNVPCVFVSIASYRDSELIPTLMDMISQSSSPQSLHISICWQCDEDISIFLDQGIQLTQERLHHGYNLYLFSYRGAVIQVISVHYYQSQGACWARHIAETLYDNEEYFLQIDSHCRVISCWDSQMIEELNNLTVFSPKPILTCYPPSYQPDKLDEKKSDIIRLMFRGFSQEKILQLSPYVMAEDVTYPVRGSYLAGGFIFSLGSFVTEVPNDPQIFFEGEEIAMAVRAFTHGYDIFHPQKVLLWHFYGRKDHVKVWTDHGNEAKTKGSIDQAWWERDAISKNRVKTLLGHKTTEQCDHGIYCLGKQRSLSDFERRAGVDFSRCMVHPDVIGDEHKAYFSNGELIEGIWRSLLVGVYKKTIKFDSFKITTLGADALYWYVGVYTENNTLLEQQTLYSDEINEKISNSEDGSFSLSLDFTSEEILNPHSVRISPFIDSVGWGEVVEEAW